MAGFVCVHLQQLKLKRRAGGLVQKGQELLLAFLGVVQPSLHTHTLKLRSSSGDNRKKPDRDSSSVAGPLLGFLAVFKATYCFCARSGACCISNFPSQRPIIQRKQVCVFTAEGFAVRFFSEVEASLNLNLRPELVGSTLLCRWLKQSRTCLMQSKR